MATYGAWFKSRLEQVKQTQAYRVQQLTLSFASTLANLMKERQVSKVQFAERVGTSPAYVTKVLRGDVNYTVETMVKLAAAVDADVMISLKPRSPDWQVLPAECVKQNTQPTLKLVQSTERWSDYRAAA